MAFRPAAPMMAARAFDIQQSRPQAHVQGVVAGLQAMASRLPELLPPGGSAVGDPACPPGEPTPRYSVLDRGSALYLCAFSAPGST
jgi:hypothetical protein